MTNKPFALSDKTNLYLKHAEMIRDLQSSMKKDYEALFQFIEQHLKQLFLNTTDTWEFDFKTNRGYHIIYKPHWKNKGLWIHLELALNEESLITGNVSFMLDIEGNNKKEFKQEKEELLKQALQKTLEQNGITHYPTGRTFAKKKYPLLSLERLTDPGRLSEELQRMFQEFEPFIAAVDEVLK